MVEDVTGIHISGCSYILIVFLMQINYLYMFILKKHDRLAKLKNVFMHLGNIVFMWSGIVYCNLFKRNIKQIRKMKIS